MEHGGRSPYVLVLFFFIMIKVPPVCGRYGRKDGKIMDITYYMGQTGLVERYNNAVSKKQNETKIKEKCDFQMTMQKQKVGDNQLSAAGLNDGTITHNGVTFVIDGLNRSISLGDVSKGNKVLSVRLSNGYELKVNWNNIDDLSRCLDLFSPEDVRRIMSAIELQKKCDSMDNEMEDCYTKLLDKAQRQFAGDSDK